MSDFPEAAVRRIDTSLAEINALRRQIVTLETNIESVRYEFEILEEFDKSF